MSNEPNNQGKGRGWQINSIAPILTLALLLVTPWYLGAHETSDLGTAIRHAKSGMPLPAFRKNSAVG